MLDWKKIKNNKNFNYYAYHKVYVYAYHKIKEKKCWKSAYFSQKYEKQIYWIEQSDKLKLVKRICAVEKSTILLMVRQNNGSNWMKKKL